MMEIIGEGRRAYPSVPRGVKTVTVRCTVCGYTKTCVKAAWVKSRKLCPVCTRPAIGTVRDGWELVGWPEKGGTRQYAFRCLSCGRVSHKLLAEWARPCACTTYHISQEAREQGQRSRYDRGRKVNRNSTSGVRGVSWSPKLGKWRAQIMLDRKQIYLGVYEKKEDAIAARKAAEVRYFGEKQEALGLVDQYAQPAPEGKITLAEWAAAHGRTKGAGKYHVRQGHVETVTVGGVVYVDADAPWPTDAK